MHDDVILGVSLGATWLARVMPYMSTLLVKPMPRLIPRPRSRPSIGSPLRTEVHLLVPVDQLVSLILGEGASPETAFSPLAEAPSLESGVAMTPSQSLAIDPDVRARVTSTCTPLAVLTRGTRWESLALSPVTVRVHLSTYRVS